jgi:hypothetical protein
LSADTEVSDKYKRVTGEKEWKEGRKDWKERVQKEPTVETLRLG